MRSRKLSLRLMLSFFCSIIFWGTTQAFTFYDNVSFSNLNSTVHQIMIDYKGDKRLNVTAAEITMSITTELSRGTIASHLGVPQPSFLAGNSIWEGFVWTPISGQQIRYGSAAYNLTNSKELEPFEITTGASRRFPNFKGNDHLWMYTFYTISGNDNRGHLHIIIVEKDISLKGDSPQKRINPNQHLETLAFNAEQAYPNPFSDQLYIGFQNANDGNVITELSTMSQPGKVLLRKEDFYNNGAHQLTWNVSNLLPGAYLLRMEMGNEVIYQKIIKAAGWQ